MIRLFHVYYPIRTLILLLGEALIVWTSFLVAVVVDLREDSYLVLNYEGGWLKLFIFTAVVLLCSHWFDLYDTARLNTKGELYFRLFMVLGMLSFVTAGISWIRPDFLLRGNSSVLGLLILTLALFGWRLGYGWLVQLPMLAERVYVLGTTERAQRLVQGLRQNPEIGVEIASWTGKLEGAVTREAVAEHLMDVVKKQKVHRVIVAMPDRRGTMPMDELLQLRMEGVKIEEATSWLERISGKIELENLNPSWIVFNDGFQARPIVYLSSAAFLSCNFIGRADHCGAPDSADHARHPARFRWACFLYPDPHGQGWNACSRWSSSAPCVSMRSLPPGRSGRRTMIRE